MGCSTSAWLQTLETIHFVKIKNRAPKGFETSIRILNIPYIFLENGNVVFFSNKDMLVTFKKQRGTKGKEKNICKDPNNSTISSLSSKPFSLHQTWKNTNNAI